MKNDNKIQRSFPSKLTLAANLYVVEMEMAKMEERRSELRAQLFDELKRQGVKAVRLENGVWYKRAERPSIKIVNQTAAWKWGIENPEARLKIDSGAVEKAFKGKAQPKWFKRSITEFLVISRPKENEHGDN